MAEKPPAPAIRDFALQLEAYERQQELGTYPPPILMLVTVFTGVIGLAMVAAGVALVWLGASR
jgi:hypothetical protein